MNSSIGAAFVEKQQCKGFGTGQAHGVHGPAILTGPLGLERQVLANTFCFPIFSEIEWFGVSELSEEENRRLPSLWKRPLPAVNWTALTVEMCKVDGSLAAVLTLIMFETGSSQEISAPTTFVIDLFSTGTEFQRFFLKRCTVRKTRSFL